MKITRKDFLRIAGGSVVAASAGKLVKAVGDVAQAPSTVSGSKIATSGAGD